jgi:hypothetical protein
MAGGGVGVLLGTVVVAGGLRGDDFARVRGAQLFDDAHGDVPVGVPLRPQKDVAADDLGLVTLRNR